MIYNKQNKDKKFGDFAQTFYFFVHISSRNG